MFLDAPDLRTACDWVIVNNTTLKGHRPQRFANEITGKTGTALQRTIEGIILRDSTREHQIEEVTADPRWWTIEDLIVHFDHHRVSQWISNPGAITKAQKNHECYETIRKSKTDCNEEVPCGRIPSGGPG